MNACPRSPLSLPRRLARVALILGVLEAAACGGDDSQSPGNQEEPVTAGCREGTLSQSPALYRVCFPAAWNGDLVVYAHGYVSADEPLAIPDDAVEGQPIEQIVNGLGYGYATTSYRANGLVADQAVDDVAQLVEEIRGRFTPDPSRVVVVGVSEGGLVAALTAEQHDDLFDAALAMCGPIGDFAGQVDYLGDFRVLFDYYFPGVIPGGPVDVPDTVRAQWNTIYVPKVTAALQADAATTLELLTVAGAPHDPQDLPSAGATVLGILWYDIFALPDARARLGGQPYDNQGRDVSWLVRRRRAQRRRRAGERGSDRARGPRRVRDLGRAHDSRRDPAHAGGSDRPCQPGGPVRGQGGGERGLGPAPAAGTRPLRALHLHGPRGASGVQRGHRAGGRRPPGRLTEAEMRIGVLSDTHGLLRPEVFDVFSGVDHILHGGDVGREAILDELQAIAPLTAVYGNTDVWALRHRLPRVARVELDGFTIIVTHGDQLGSPTPDRLQAEFPDAEIIVFGHTHRPVLTLVDTVVTVMNPGGAGPRRFDLPASVGILELEPGIPPRGRLVPLTPADAD